MILTAFLLLVIQAVFRKCREVEIYCYISNRDMSVLINFIVDIVRNGPINT